VPIRRLSRPAPVNSPPRPRPHTSRWPYSTRSIAATLGLRSFVISRYVFLRSLSFPARMVDRFSVSSFSFPFLFLFLRRLRVTSGRIFFNAQNSTLVIHAHTAPSPSSRQLSATCTCPNRRKHNTRSRARDTQAFALPPV
jgi:hypothetical protein